MMSPLQLARLNFSPALPTILKNIKNLSLVMNAITEPSADLPQLKKHFPLTFGQPTISFQKDVQLKTFKPKKVGVVFSGGQAAGGHNVIAGLFDALKLFDSNSLLLGFIGGPSGIINHQVQQLDENLLAGFRNQGGFDLIGSGRTKIETQEQLKASLETVNKLDLDALVIIGGDDSNTNAAILAEFFKAQSCKTQVIGVPKTIDGDLKNEMIEISFGFDTACKVYSECIGNILRDCLSAKKYYHFIKLMGRSASHIALECAFQTHPNLTLVSEEVAKEKMTLQQMTYLIADLVCKRAESKKNYGVILIPEGLIEFIPEMKVLISEINAFLALEKREGETWDFQNSDSKHMKSLMEKLTPSSQACFSLLPEWLQKQLLLERDSHGNVQVSQIATEQLLIFAVTAELSKRKKEGTYAGSFNPLPHFFGYEGRCSLPSNFDSQYCYSLGFVAALLIEHGLSGYMAVVNQLTKPVEEWQIAGVPITSMMTMEKRGEVEKPVIHKALVNISGHSFKIFKANRESWAYDDVYLSPGPIQFFGEKEITDSPPHTLGS